MPAANVNARRALRLPLFAATALAALLWPAHPALAAATVVKSPADTREYALVTLPNRLTAVLVSDPKADKAAASLDVHVGYYDDPAARPGLAHFLEHMLFLGTQKYPEADSYRTFIQTHGGSQNAYTAAEHTNFYFDIDKDHLAEALDRFSQFFTAPLFDERYVAREMNAVDSEYRLKIKDDGRRLGQVDKATANPRHPYSKFAVGSIATLGDGAAVRADLLEFYARHYSANMMTLAVLGKESLAELERMVRRAFAQIPDRDRKALAVAEPLYTDAQRATRIAVAPVKDERQLRLSFTLPWQREYFLSKPALLPAHLLGHEGRGSLFAALKAKGWAYGLAAGSDAVASDQAVFSISVDLTAAGLDHVDEIVAEVFRYIALIRRDGVKPWLLDELRRTNELAFRYREESAPIREVSALARDLHDYPPELVLRGPYQVGPFDETLVRSTLAHLTPDNLRLTVMAKGLATNRVEPWYDAAYRIDPLPPETIAAWRAPAADPALALPAPNPFLPKHTALKPPAETTPQPVAIEAGTGLTVWHKQDDQFRVPKADIFLTLETARAADTVRHAALTDLFLALVRDALNERTYPARLAGLQYSVAGGSRGITVSTSGYDEKQPLLLDLVLEALLEPLIDPRRFAVKKEELLEDWENSRLERPSRQLPRELGTLLVAGRWTADEMRRAAADLAPQDLTEFVPELFARIRATLLVHGNVTRPEAAALGRRIAAHVFARAAPGPEIAGRIVRLAPGGRYLRTMEIEHDDSAVAEYFQAADDGIAAQARVALLLQVLETPFFNRLRTEEQLGYVVYAGDATMLRVPGLMFVVQSPRAGPDRLTARIEAFLDGYAPLLEAMDDAEFERHKAGLLTRLIEKDVRLGQRSQRYQHDLALGYLAFDHRERLAEAVRALSKDELAAAYTQLLGAAERRRLIVQSTGRAAAAQDAPGTPAAPAAPAGAIADIDAFKKSLPAFES